MRSRQLLAAAGLVILACGGDDGPSAPPDGDGGTTVTVSNNIFTPSSLTVPVNSTVTWQWNSGGTAHNVTFADGVKSNDMSSGTYARTFTAAGSYPYACTLHPPNMTGVVTVTASTTGGDGTGGTGGGGGGGGYNP
jgi:plastocyanin